MSESLNRMKDKIVLITGGGGGIARGLERAFANEGAKFILTDVSEAALAAAKEAIEGDFNTEVFTAICDGSDEAAVEKTVKEAADHFGKIDVLINNAQASASGVLLADHTREQFDLAIATGLYSTFFFMKHCFPYLKETQGSVINFASGAGINGNAGQASYAAAKEGIRGLSRVAANEWGIYNINVNIVLPLVMTDRLAQWGEENPEMFEKNIKSIPLGRYGDAEKDLGRICVFLASEDAEYITGDTLFIQGGSGMKP